MCIKIIALFDLITKSVKWYIADFQFLVQM